MLDTTGVGSTRGSNLSNTNTVASINVLTKPQRQVPFAARFEF